MAIDEGMLELVREALEPMGTVTSRRMMGGATLYLDGTVFAILADDALWFKADATSDAAWDAEGAARFTYAKGDGTTGSMNYRAAPADVYDDPDEMRRTAALAIEAGHRGAKPKGGAAKRRG